MPTWAQPLDGAVVGTAKAARGRRTREKMSDCIILTKYPLAVIDTGCRWEWAKELERWGTKEKRNSSEFIYFVNHHILEGPKRHCNRVELMNLKLSYRKNSSPRHLHYYHNRRTALQNCATSGVFMRDVKLAELATRKLISPQNSCNAPVCKVNYTSRATWESS
jgi:hypothetical protein